MEYNERDLMCQDCHYHKEAISKAKLTIPNTGEIDLLAQVFKVFGDSTRLKILCALMDTELCVCDLSEMLHLNQSAVSQQLRVLRTANLVKNRRQGKQIIYSLNDGHVLKIISQALDHVRE